MNLRTPPTRRCRRQLADDTAHSPIPPTSQCRQCQLELTGPDSDATNTLMLTNSPTCLGQARPGLLAARSAHSQFKRLTRNPQQLTFGLNGHSQPKRATEELGARKRALHPNTYSDSDDDLSKSEESEDESDEEIPVTVLFRMKGKNWTMIFTLARDMVYFRFTLLPRALYDNRDTQS